MDFVPGFIVPLLSGMNVIIHFIAHRRLHGAPRVQVLRGPLLRRQSPQMGLSERD